VLRQGFEMLAHPLRKVCYEPLAAHYHEKYRSKYPVHHAKILILDLALLFIAGGLTVFWIFANSILPLIPVPSLVNIEMLAPRTLVSGAPSDFVIAYRNDSPQPLSCAQLRIRLPADTVLEEEPLKTELSRKTCYVEHDASAMLTDPTEPDVHVILLGTIEPNGRDAVRFKARTYGPTGSTKTMTAELQYWDVGATEPTRVSTRNEWQVTDSALALDITTPEVVSRGQARTVSLSYANRGEDALQGAVVRLSVPEDFTVTGSSPAADSRGEWHLGTLDPGEEGKITVFGYFRPTAGGAAPTFAARGYVEAGGKLTLAELVRKNADPGAADVEFAAEILSPAGRSALLPGEEIQVKVTYRNAGRTDLKDMRIVLDPGAAFITNEAPEGLVWDAKSRQGLADVKPGDAGEFIASFAVPQTIPDGEPPILHVSAAASYASSGAAAHEVRIDTPVIDLPVATRLAVDAAALYYTKDGDQLGIGPLPPKAGETTKYRVFLTVSTTTGAAENVVVEAFLGPDAAWTGHATVTAGEPLDHFASTGRLRWTIGTVPAGVGGDTKFGATFEVAITPGKGEVGSAPQLLKSIKVTGIDAATGLQLHGVAENITTDLPYDKRALGKGTVVEN
jgi:hypothetical protein